jgi:hypothetical protein
MSYTFNVPETAGNLDWRPEQIQADNRRTAVFFRPLALCRLQWSGLGGGVLALAGFLYRRYANPAMCPATPIGVGSRVIQPDTGGRTMRHISARSEQTQFPLFTRAGREAAELWLTCAPMTAADWRDLRFRNLIAGLSFDDLSKRRQVFDEAFCKRIASAIAHAEVE